MKKNARLGGLVSVALWASTAFAQEEQPLHLQYRGAAGCPNRDEFVAHVRARTERVRFVEKKRGALDLDVRADAEGGRATGRFRLGTENAPRLVTGRTCEDVISALALIAALAVDPAASTEGSALGAVSEEGGVGTTRDGARPHAANDAAAWMPAGAAGSASETSVDAPESGHAHARTGRWFAGAGSRGEVWRGFGKGAMTMLGASVHGEIGVALGGSWRPALRLAAAFGQSPTVIPTERPDVGAATFTLIAARATVCPLELRPRESFAVRPCATLEVGRLEGRATPVDNGSITLLRAGQAWRLAAGLSLQGKARLTRALWLEMEAGASEPLLRQRFVFSNPDVTVASPPVIEAGLALGLGMYFP